MSSQQILILSIRLDLSGSLLSRPISCLGENFFVFVWGLPCVKLNLSFSVSLVWNKQLVGFALGLSKAHVLSS